MIRFDVRLIADVLPYRRVWGWATRHDLEPWPVEQARPYSGEFVAGHLCRTYDKDAEQALPEAKQEMEQGVERTVRSDIGGDRQRIHQLRSSWNYLGFKHILLPIWLLTDV
jgi:hypothetical protein